ncbi:MAG: Sulfate transport system permease protein CysW [Gemmatimonadaceae bacterium]|nr:Sulfate transport system permease protein CysW [Gemmatimonadaceae bacterium]
MQRAMATVLAALLASLLLLFLAAPIVELIARAGGTGIARLGSDKELRAALTMTTLCALVATALGVLGGTPLAWLLSRRRFRGRAILSAVLDLPLLIPHPVAGIALLLVFGRDSAAGQAAIAFGLRVVGTPVGIVLAMLFVSASLFISGAREAFARVDRRYEAVARTLGDSAWRAFRRVTLPLAARGILASAIVMWARAVSEFGAIVILTYNPKTASVLSYDRFTAFGLPDALPVAAVLALLALIPLTLLRALRVDGAAAVERA